MSRASTSGRINVVVGKPVMVDPKAIRLGIPKKMIKDEEFERSWKLADIWI